MDCSFPSQLYPTLLMAYLQQLLLPNILCTTARKSYKNTRKQKTQKQKSEEADLKIHWNNQIMNFKTMINILKAPKDKGDITQEQKDNVRRKMGSLRKTQKAMQEIKNNTHRNEEESLCWLK